MDPREDLANALRARGNLVQLVFGHMAAQVVSVAARLGLADLIGDDELTALEVAEKSGAQAESMNRLLRALAALGVLTEVRAGCFALTPVGALLRTDRPDSLHAFTRMFTDPAMLQAWQELESSAVTGQTAFGDVFGTDFFTYLNTRPDLSALFNTAMSQATLATAAVLPHHYPFERFESVVDIGGGDGTLISAILREHQALRGILFDTPEGLARAEQTLRQADILERCAITPGDFFAAVPDGGDLYLIKSVVHDWDDERAATILTHCRRAIPAHGRLLLIEPVLPDIVDSAYPAVMYLSDLNMLVNLGGRERTRADFEELCRRSGFALTGITPLPPPAAFCIIEAEPARACFESGGGR